MKNVDACQMMKIPSLPMLKEGMAHINKHFGNIFHECPYEVNIILPFQNLNDIFEF
jgi:hypothetical protein